MSIITDKKRKASSLTDGNDSHQATCNGVAKGWSSPVLIQSEELQSDVTSEINDKRVSFHNKVKIRHVKRVTFAERFNVWYTKAEYVRFRERESKLKRDNVLESHGIQQATTTTTILHTTQQDKQEAAILYGNRAIRRDERKLKVHKSNRARYATQMTLLEQKVVREEKAIFDARTSLADSRASVQASIKTLDNQSPVMTCNVKKLLEEPSSFRDEDEKLARILALEAELARCRAFSL